MAPTVLRSEDVKKVLVMAAGYNSEIIKKIRNDFRNDLIVAYLHQGKLVYDKKTLPIDSVCQALDAMEGMSGIGKNLFESISSLTPAVSVELIIKSQDQQSNLLTWRDDELYGPGWHVPGGVVRFKETLSSRVDKVLKQKLLHLRQKLTGPLGFTRF